MKFIKYNTVNNTVSVNINKLLNASIRIPYHLNETLTKIPLSEATSKSKEENDIETMMGLSRQFDRYILNIQEEIYEFKQEYFNLYLEDSNEAKSYEYFDKSIKEYSDILLYCCTLLSIMTARYTNMELKDVFLNSDEELNKFSLFNFNLFGEKNKVKKTFTLDDFSINFAVKDIQGNYMRIKPNILITAIENIDSFIIEQRRIMFPQRKWHKRPTRDEMVKSFTDNFEAFYLKFRRLISESIFAMLFYLFAASYVDGNELLEYKSNVTFGNKDSLTYKFFFERKTHYTFDEKITFNGDFSNESINNFIIDCVNKFNNILYSKNKFTLGNLNVNPDYLY